MDERRLRELIREEVERTLDEELTIDSHPKFRRLIESQLGRKLGEDTWDLTFQAWADAVAECGSNRVDEEALQYYVSEAVKQLND